jgi:hypothetical protein
MSIIKDLVTVILSILVFFIITKPESLLNWKSSNETISRERARLLIESLAEEELDKFRLSYNIIKCSYYTEEDVSSWFWDIDSLINLYILQREHNERIELEKNLLLTKMAVLKTIKDYESITGKRIVSENLFPEGKDITLNNLKNFLKSSNLESDPYKRVADSLQHVITKKLILNQ